MAAPKYVIVVATDYSAASELAFERALELAADKTNVEFHVLNVCQTELSVGMLTGVGASPPPLDDAGLALRKHVASTVSAFQSRTGRTPFARLVTHIRMDEPGLEIAQLAADVAADLVVIGTHDRRGVPRLLLGSVAEVVARVAPCPVLIVRPKALPAPAPVIEPPCPRCVAAREASQGEQFWC